HALQMMGLKLAAVTNGELATGVFARIDHPLALLDRYFHRFFTQDMFAGFSRLEGMLGMESVVSDDIDHIDVGIVGPSVHGVGVGMPVIVAPAATPAMPSDALRKNSRRECSRGGRGGSFGVMISRSRMA